MGKARVAPLKPVTIPRLELTAALTSVRVSRTLGRELTYAGVKEVFWTDSKIVKGYIYNEARRFHTYVANRVQQIRDHTQPEQWKYVDSDNNPADDASRGLSPKDLLKTSGWLRGPAFLWEPHDEWKDFDDKPPTLHTDDKEVKKITVLSTVTIEPSYVLEMVKRFSDWFRAKRVLGRCLKIARTWRAKAMDGDTGRGVVQDFEDPVTVEIMSEAERLVIKSVQNEAFSDELSRLKNQPKPSRTEEPRVKNKELKNSSPLYRLDPFVDNQGMLRVGGRIKAASISEDVKHPVILPREGHVSWLIARCLHETANHQGRGFTLNEIRASGYWIIGCSALVSKVIDACTTCKKLRARTVEQKMADLPRDRVTPSPAFTNCAGDYSGPFYVKEGRKELKRYGVLFTCLKTRAIHLEVTHSLETDSYINALRRFVCRRGPVRQMRSDQGTNLVGEKRELKDALLEMDNKKVQVKMLKLNCDWFETKLNVPSASHMGGAGRLGTPD